MAYQLGVLKQTVLNIVGSGDWSSDVYMLVGIYELS